MEDMYGIDVYDGDFMVEGNEDSCYIFRIENQRPILKGLWVTGVLEKFDIERLRKNDEKVQKNIKSKTIPVFLRNYFKDMVKRMEEMKTEKLMKVEGINLHIFKKFVEEGHEAIEYGAEELEHPPIASFPNEEIIGEY